MAVLACVVVQTPQQGGSAEFDFALRELQRQLPNGTPWFWQGDAAGAVDACLDNNRSASVLVLQHPWVFLEGRCLSQLQRALDEGFDIAVACDSQHPAPMAPGAYATLRGMERYVDEHSYGTTDTASESASMVRLFTAAAWQRGGHGGLPHGTQGGNAAVKAAKVTGAYAHDISAYFRADRADVMPLLPTTATRFLDVGGGEGNFLAALKAHCAKQCQTPVETLLVEMDASAAQIAQSQQQLDRVWVGDFFAFDSAPTWDCISFLDMLEHVPNPEDYLRHARALLADDGVIIASIPNVGHWSVVADLLEGRWDYAPIGIHCITHLRFFTQKTISDLFARADLVIDRWERTLVPGKSAWLAQWGGSSGLAVDADSLDTYAYTVVARPVRATPLGS